MLDDATSREPVDTNDTLTTFYDIVLSPFSFDYFTFLALSDLERRRKGKKRIHLVIVPKTGVEDISREDLDLGVEEQEKSWRLYSMLCAGAWILPAMSSVTVCNTREQAKILFDQANGAIFPTDHTPDKPSMSWDKGHAVWHSSLGEELQSFKISENSRTVMKNWLKPRARGRKTVAITLREALYFPPRNSNLIEWSNFARQIEAEGYFCIFVRDAATVSDLPTPELEGFTLFPEAIFSLELRVALYEICHFCMFVSNGPAETAFYNKNIDYLYFVTGNWLTDTPSPFEGQGIGFDKTPPFSTETQKWVWKSHTSELLKSEFDAMIEKVDRRVANDEKPGATPLQPASINDLFEIGQCFERTNQFKNALMSYEYVTRKNPEHALAYLRSATIRLKGSHILGVFDSERCIHELDQAEKLGAVPSVDINIERGKMLMAIGRWEDALDTYEVILANISDFPPALIQRAIALDEMGKHEDAIEAYQKLIEIGHEHPNILYRIIENLKALGRISEAAELGLKWQKMKF